MSSWLAKRTGIHINLRPLVRPAAAIAGGMLGGPAGAALGAGLAGTADDLGHGKNIGEAAVGGLKTGAETYAGAKLLPMLGHTLGLGGGDATAGAGGGTPGPAAPIGGGIGGGGGPGGISGAADAGFDRSSDVGGYTGSSAGSALPPPPGNMAQRALSSMGGFVQRNPTATLNAAGTAASTYAQASGANADRRLYRDQVLRQNALEDEERRRKQSIGTAWIQQMAKGGNPMAMELAKQLGYA